EQSDLRGPAPQLAAFRRAGLLHLADDLGSPRVAQGGPGCPIRVVGEARRNAGAGFDHDRMPVLRHLRDGVRHQRDTALPRNGLFRDPELHRVLMSVGVKNLKVRLKMKGISIYPFPSRSRSFCCVSSRSVKSIRSDSSLSCSPSCSSRSASWAVCGESIAARPEEAAGSHSRISKPSPSRNSPAISSTMSYNHHIPSPPSVTAIQMPLSVRPA